MEATQSGQWDFPFSDNSSVADVDSCNCVCKISDMDQWTIAWGTAGGASAANETSGCENLIGTLLNLHRARLVTSPNIDTFIHRWSHWSRSDLRDTSWHTRRDSRCRVRITWLTWEVWGCNSSLHLFVSLPSPPPHPSHTHIRSRNLAFFKAGNRCLSMLPSYFCWARRSWTAGLDDSGQLLDKRLSRQDAQVSFLHFHIQRLSYSYFLVNICGPISRNWHWNLTPIVPNYMRFLVTSTQWSSIRVGNIEVREPSASDGWTDRLGHNPRVCTLFICDDLIWLIGDVTA